MAARSLTTSGFVVGGVASERRRLGQHRAVALITIAYLGRVGIHWFDGLPVISYAVSADPSRDTTASYSYRLSMNFGAGRLYESYLKNLRRPAAILVGDADEHVIADQIAPLLQRLGVNIPVTIVPGMKHADMIAAPQALQVVVRAIAPHE